MHNVLGGTIDPHASYLLLRGMKTLDLRVQRQNATAMLIAARLEAHPLVTRVHYPGLASHPDHAIAVQQVRRPQPQAAPIVDSRGQCTRQQPVFSWQPWLSCSTAFPRASHSCPHPSPHPTQPNPTQPNPPRFTLPLQMSGYGGVVSFEIDGDLWRTAKFIDSVQLPYIAPSLGGVESLIEQPTVIRCAAGAQQGRSVEVGLGKGGLVVCGASSSWRCP